MTKEYIEREKALEKVIEVKHHDPELSGVVLHRYIKEIDLKDIPAADVAPVTTLNELTKEIHDNAVSHGWWDEPRNLLEIVALCHSELSEAVEEYRAGHPMVWANEDGKPEGIATEMADCLIRILDWFGHEGLDADEIVRQKMTYNRGRPYKHGKRC